MAASRPASRAGELHELIQRALRNQRELLGRMIRGILFESQSQAPAGAEKSGGDIWPPEYEESVHYFAQRIGKGVPANAPIIDFAAFPITVGPAVWPLAELRRAALAAMEDTPEMPHDFIGAAEIAASYATNASLRGMDQTRDRFWQLFQNGLLHFRVVLERGIYEEELVSLINGGLNFTALFYSELGLAEETIRMEMNVSNTQDVEMHTARSGPAPHFVCRIPAVKIRQKVSAATLLSARRDCADQFLNELAVRFNAPVQPRSVPNP
ncbi:hypothetical protein SDC9_122899 [bioreactor metagenome]|uniref:Uncharacterized protein n=1 Tax=bioreactor metagenome TaxID=1076179 RepID=A0A645CG26_9ZZZZ